MALPSALKVAAAALVVVLGRYPDPPLLSLSPVPGLREVFSAVALFLVFGFGLCWKRGGAVDGDGEGVSRPGAALASSNIVMRWRVILSRLKDCCWGCSLSASAMSVDFGTTVTHPLRIVILLVGFPGDKMLMLWLIASRLAYRAPSAAGCGAAGAGGVSSRLWCLAPRGWRMYWTANGQKR